ncbi:hypothetical protein OROGR_009898 [Orobanche gracilis]
MSKNYDNWEWERLVNAVLLREELRRLCREDSLPSFCSSDSSRSFLGIENSPSNLGISFSHHQISVATNRFSNQNLIRRGRSGDLFVGHFRQFSEPSVVKRILSWKADFSPELDFVDRIIRNSHPRFVPLLGHCLDDGKEKFIVYRYLPERDLTNSLFRKDDDGLPSLDWITRWKIARGVAEGLEHLHHECNPPLVHGDVQASSILLDHNFEVRLGSLSQVSVERIPKEKITFTWRSKKAVSGPDGTPKTTCAHDIYCFGKVLLELVTGNLGISSSTDENLKVLLETTLLHISIYDKELVTNIVDPSLLLDEDLLDEVWAVAIVARSCLNPEPAKRPVIRDILKALENPMKVISGPGTSAGPSGRPPRASQPDRSSKLITHISSKLKKGVELT